MRCQTIRGKTRCRKRETPQKASFTGRAAKAAEQTLNGRNASKASSRALFAGVLETLPELRATHELDDRLQEGVDALRNRDSTP